MNWAKRGIILLIATALGVIAIGRAAQHDVYEQHNKGIVITEDDPRWNCRTMGNGICGGK